MPRKKLLLLLLPVVAVVAFGLFQALDQTPDGSNASLPSAAPGEVPVPGLVTMVDLGAKSCIPCKMMAPILVELEEEYRGRAAIRFIDVWENPAAGGPFGINLIPTQIFYDASGKEVLRHEGYMEKKDIVAVLQKLGVT